MSKKRDEVEFGSDSFLDVLANIVGILIILIVIAGTQLTHMPIKPILLKSPPSTAAPAPAATAPAQSTPIPVDIPEIVDTEPEPLGPDAPPVEIAAQLVALDEELDALDGLAEAKKEELQSLSSKAQKVERSAAEWEALLKARRGELARKRAEALALNQVVKRTKNDLSGVLAEFEDVKQTKSNAKELKHTLTPISQMIEGPEMHFRLSENKISVIPLEELVGRLKTQIDRQKDYLAKHRKQEGTVGPIRGFSMQYLIEAKPLSAFEEIRHGHGAFRIGVSMWEIIPMPDLEGETAVQAMRAGSDFVRALNSAPEHASLTMWVYPDSFNLFRKLQAAAHEAGFVVTGRPLPAGTPIAGSPNGSRSAGQ